MKKVYFISGLGADQRVFSFLDLAFCDPVFINWIKPFHREALKDYALRLRSSIPDPDPAIVGISFGGMLVTEMAKSDKNVNGIIISSNKTSNEFPNYLRYAKTFPLYKWLPGKLSKRALLSLKWILGPRGEKQEKLLRDIILDSDSKFISWALGAIFNWKNKEVPDHLVHIHGTDDKLLPYRFVKPNYTINGGTHVMVMNNADEVSAILKKLLG